MDDMTTSPVAVDDRGDATDDKITGVVSVLIALRRLSRSQVCRGTGISSVTLERRLSRAKRGGHWTALDVAMLSAYFDLPVEVFYAGPDPALLGVRDRSAWFLPPADGVSNSPLLCSTHS